MVTRKNARSERAGGSLLIELLVAMALLTGALLPVAYSIASERRLAVSVYQRAVAMEIVDGEMEILAKGAWRNYTNGAHDYKVGWLAATNLPPGKFRLTRADSTLRLEWLPNVKDHGGRVSRDLKLK